MAKLYIIAFGSEIKVKTLTDLFDKTPTIEFWFFSLPQSIFIKTSLTATEINNFLLDYFGDAQRFISEVSTTDFAGMVPNDQLKYFNF
ncbi:MAG TPA: hypothetical protein VFE53_21470 [Mucilaginibacter sp.]|nr:hypothetical protein [Mucilaginibacter sp.]